MSHNQNWNSLLFSQEFNYSLLLWCKLELSPLLVISSTYREGQSPNKSCKAIVSFFLNNCKTWNQSINALSYDCSMVWTSDNPMHVARWDTYFLPARRVFFRLTTAATFPLTCCAALTIDPTLGRQVKYTLGIIVYHLLPWLWKFVH